MEALPGGDLVDAVGSAGVLAADVAADLGRAVAGLHVEGRGLDGDVPSSGWAAGGIDWHRPGPAHLRVLSGAGIELLETLQRSQALCAHLARIGRPRDPDTLIHGDLRWENVIVAAQGPPPMVWLVNWEFAGRGESAWDVACVLAAGVGGWLSTIPQVPGIPPGRLVDEASLPIDAIRPGLAAFWTAYLEGARPPQGDAWFERCLQLVAARLVHQAFEATDREEHLHAAPVAHLQVALNVLEQPARAPDELLGIVW